MSAPNHPKGNGGGGGKGSKKSTGPRSKPKAEAASKPKKVSGNNSTSNDFRIPKNPAKSPQSAASNGSKGHLAAPGPLSDPSGVRPGTPRPPIFPNLGLFGGPNQNQNAAKVLPPPCQTKGPAAVPSTTALSSASKLEPRPTYGPLGLKNKPPIVVANVAIDKDNGDVHFLDGAGKVIPQFSR